MNIVNKSKKTASLMGIRMLISGILVFFGALLYIPQSGIVRTLPFIAVLAAVGDVFYKSIIYNCGCAFLFSFCMLSVNGKDLYFCTVYSALATLFCLGSIYGVRLLRASYKTGNPELKKKCIVRSILVLAVSFAAYMLVCGNIVGAFTARLNNYKYLTQYYGKSVKPLYTSFDAVSREYRTYVSFTHDGIVVGGKDDCYVSRCNSEDVTDNVRDYYEDLLLLDGKKNLKGNLSSAVDMFEITNCGMSFEKGEIIKPEMSYGDFSHKTWYVVSLYHMVDNKSDFQKLYDDCVSVLENLDFKEIVICAGNAQEVLYTATVSKENGILNAQPVIDFDEAYLEEYGVTEKTVLDYWYNR